MEKSGNWWPAFDLRKPACRWLKQLEESCRRQQSNNPQEEPQVSIWDPNDTRAQSDSPVITLWNSQKEQENPENDSFTVVWNNQLENNRKLTPVMWGEFKPTANVKVVRKDVLPVINNVVRSPNYDGEGPSCSTAFTTPVNRRFETDNTYKRQNPTKEHLNSDFKRIPYNLENSPLYVKNMVQEGNQKIDRLMQLVQRVKDGSKAEAMQLRRESPFYRSGFQHYVDNTAFYNMSLLQYLANTIRSLLFIMMEVIRNAIIFCYLLACMAGRLGIELINAPRTMQLIIIAAMLIFEAVRIVLIYQKAYEYEDVKTTYNHC